MSFNTADQTVTLHFKLPMAPALPARPFFNFSVYDPSYFIAFSFEKEAPVALQAASAGCSLSVVKPSELSAADQRKLNEAYLSNMSPGEDFGSKLADRAIIACP
jgi:ABC-type uncharacterized transport system substrate-binding protein